MKKNKEKEIVGGEDVTHLEKATPAETRLARESKTFNFQFLWKEKSCNQG